MVNWAIVHYIRLNTSPDLHITETVTSFFAHNSSHIMKRFVAILLIILGVIMIGLSLKLGAYPPGITGIGFIAIAVVFLSEKT